MNSIFVTNFNTELDMRDADDDAVPAEERLRFKRAPRVAGGSGLREALKKILLDWCSYDEITAEMAKRSEASSKEKYGLETRQTSDAEVQSFKEEQERELELSRSARKMNLGTTKHEKDIGSNESVGEATRAYVQSEVASATEALRQMFDAERETLLKREEGFRELFRAEYENIRQRQRQQKNAGNDELARQLQYALAKVEPMADQIKHLQDRIEEMEIEIDEGQQKVSRLRTSQDILKQKLAESNNQLAETNSQLAGTKSQLDALRSSQRPPAPAQHYAYGYGPGYGPGYGQGYGQWPAPPPPR